MGKIRVLSSALANQIAAGEVVSRPSAAIKELVENALDAGAKRIRVEIEKGGVERIAVIDDGEGMERIDAEASILRHATSKIATKEDLSSIASFGFRGEALASIASVSHFLIETRQREAIAGTRVAVNGGFVGEIGDCGCPEGTRVEVKNLFWNVPARLKFLKSEATERTHAARIVEEAALANPEIGFEFLTNGRESLRVPARQSTADRIDAIFGVGTAKTMLPCGFRNDSISIEGFCSPAGNGFSSRDRQIIFVNRRCVTDKTVLSAVRAAYASMLPHGQHPQFVLFLTIAPDTVDVNVHPQKAEVRFLRGNEIFLAVKHAIEEALAGDKKILSPFFEGGRGVEREMSGNSTRFDAPKMAYGSALPTPLGRGEGWETSKTERWHLSQPQSLYRPNGSQATAAIDFSATILKNPQKDAIFSMPYSAEAERKPYRIIGQARNSFLILETKNGILILDQHAVHERTRFDRLSRALETKKAASQSLLFPTVIDLSASQSGFLEIISDPLHALGFSWEALSERIISLSAVPDGYRDAEWRTLFPELLAEIATEGTKNALHAAKKRALTFLSCRGAVKFGDPLTEAEIDAIVQEWLAEAAGAACPHGRPVAWEIPFSEIEKKVSR